MKASRPINDGASKNQSTSLQKLSIVLLSVLSACRPFQIAMNFQKKSTKHLGQLSTVYCLLSGWVSQSQYTLCSK